jgi:hypothetical protein
MAELNNIILPILCSKGISDKTLDSFVLWYLNKEDEEKAKRFGELFIYNVTDDYIRGNWKQSFSMARFGAKFLNTNTNDLDKLEELIQQEIDERDRRNSEDY